VIALLLYTFRVLAPGDTYPLHIGKQALVTSVKGEYKDAVASVTWKVEGSPRRQVLHLPGGWWPINTAEQDDHRWRRAAVVQWTYRPDVIFVHAWRESGVYDFTGFFPFRFAKGCWQPLAVEDSCPIEFSGRGGFCLDGKRVFLWDYAAESDTCHMCPQRYDLSEYRLAGNRLIKVATRRTKKRYTPETAESLGVPDVVAAKDDPLREFELRWRWWAPQPSIKALPAGMY